MRRISATTRIALCLSLLMFSVLSVARSLGLGPNHDQTLMEGRSRYCESLAISSSLFISRGDMASLRIGLESAVRRNPDVVSAALRRQDGNLVVKVGDHHSHWPTNGEGPLPESNMYVPLLDGDRDWGKLEISFRPKEAVFGFWSNSMTGFMICSAAASCIPFFFFLKQSLQQLNPSKVVPHRVREALDTLAGGLVILDKNERIVLANKAFAQTLGKDSDQLQGYVVSQLPWKDIDQTSQNYEFPWTRSIRDGDTLRGEMLSLKMSASEQYSFAVSCGPVLGGNGERRGALVSFEDITKLENKKFELGQMLDVLRNSREEIRQKNEKLQVLATQDPLTSCMNRRSFYERLEKDWNAARRYDHSLSCIMLDIDHFKSINDTHGHSTGDLVLKKLSAALQTALRDSDALCRYGGEEFIVLLPHLDIDEGCEAAERYRRIIEELDFPNLNVTSSFGVSAISLGGASPQYLLEEADKSLYVAKRSGRNQVARWDNVPDEVDLDTAENSRDKSEKDPAGSILDDIARSQADDDISISFHVVTALTSALAYRDESTAAHSRRVADLCVAVGAELMSVVEVYVLEVAALLHDIGKIGVPDAILLKPGPLTAEEWKVMGMHDRIGVEIISSTFASNSLLEIIESHHALYGGHGRDPNLPTGRDIPLAARILTIVDAYDAMVSDRVYRKGISQEEAFVELRRCAETQFDPELVETFIEVVTSRDENRRTKVSAVSKETALRLGEQMERLAHAIDNEDFPGLAALAGRMNSTAMMQGVPEIADVAAELQVAACDVDLTKTVQFTNELLELCRSVQKVHVDRIEVEVCDIR